MSFVRVVQTFNTDHRFPLHHVDLSKADAFLICYDVAHAAGWELFKTCMISDVFPGVGSVLDRPCTISQSGRLRSR